MNQREAEVKIKDKIREAFAIAKEYEPRSNYLSCAVMRNEEGGYSARVFNDAFRLENDLNPLNGFFDFHDLPKTKEVDFTVPDLMSRDEFIDLFDEAVKQALAQMKKDGAGKDLEIKNVMFASAIRTKLKG